MTLNCFKAIEFYYAKSKRYSRSFISSPLVWLNLAFGNYTSSAVKLYKVVEIAKVLGVRPEWLASGIEPMTDNNNKLKHSELKNTRLKLNIFEEMKNQDLEEFVEIPL
ncbi:hypothetical protein [Arsenophonus apicola]|uniref:hypothetical protein n=1 Tax=Arsenophonus apicola TaxID=2879119 RepID=UPI001CDD1CA3|nr:hypothetical protein [Arsenophonus apicola]UBX30844.1 hypothetical protein LDL57_16585 [Arsenophonus apicola]